MSRRVEDNYDTLNAVYRLRVWPHLIFTRYECLGGHPPRIPPEIELERLIDSVVRDCLDPRSVEVHVDHRTARDLMRLRGFCRFGEDGVPYTLRYADLPVRIHHPVLELPTFPELNAPIPEEPVSEPRLIAITYMSRSGLRLWRWGPSTSEIWRS